MWCLNKKKGEGLPISSKKMVVIETPPTTPKRSQRGGDDFQSEHKSEKVEGKIFGDPVHAAIVKFGVVFFIANYSLVGVLPDPSVALAKMFKEDVLGPYIAAEDDAHDAHESEDFQSTSSFLARTHTTLLAITFTWHQTRQASFRGSSYFRKKASAIRTHAT